MPGYWVYKPKDKEEHDCVLPPEHVSEQGAVWRCSDCWTLWKRRSSWWEHAPWWTRLRYRNRPPRLRTTAIIGSADGKRPPSNGAWTDEARVRSAEEFRDALNRLAEEKDASS